MRDWTDDQFRRAGWKWVPRYEGRAMACTVSAFDAAMWQQEGIGTVVNLDAKEG